MTIEPRRINRIEQFIRVIRDIIRNTAFRILTRIITDPPLRSRGVRLSGQRCAAEKAAS